jgi:hypothetical protein
MENLAHRLKNSKKKGKIETITTQDQEEITPNEIAPLGETKTPKGETINNQPRKWKNNNLINKFPFTLCGEYGHYTHHFPQIFDFKWMKQSINM